MEIENTEEIGQVVQSGEPLPSEIGQEQEAVSEQGNVQGEQVSAPTFDVSVYEKEYAEQGELSEESYQALEKAGLPKSMVDTYIQGQQAVVATRTAEIKGVAGGEVEYSRLVEWAKDRLTEAEKQAFNKSVGGSDLASAKLAVEGLTARFKASLGYTPKGQLSGTESPTSSGYGSMAEMVRDVQDVRYKSDEGYRKRVIAKAAISKF